MDIEDAQDNEPKLCRICLEEESKDSENMEYQFISPCKCKGTSKFVHVHCLRSWLESKRQQIKPNPIAQSAQAISNFNLAVFLSRSNRLNLNFLPLTNSHAALSSIFNNIGLAETMRNFQGPQLGLHNLFLNPANSIHNSMNINTNPVSTNQPFNTTSINNTTMNTEQRLNETLDQILSETPANDMVPEANDAQNLLNMNPLPTLQSWLSPFNPTFNTNNAIGESNNMSNNIVNNVHTALNILASNLSNRNNNQDSLEADATRNNNNNSGANAAEQAANRLVRPSMVDNHNFSNFSCDVCKEILPYSIKLDNTNEVETVNIPRPENTPYLILERASQGKEPKVISVIKGSEQREVRLVR